MKAVAETFQAETDRVQKNGEALREGLAQNYTPMPRGEISPEIIQQFAQRLTNQIDVFRCGMKGAPKFPQTSIFEQIWRAWLRTDKRLYHNAVVTSLNNIRQGGTYDHLGGGFASSLDADSGGEEGKFYVWNEAEVDALLGEKSSDFKRVYNVDAAGNWGR